MLDKYGRDVVIPRSLSELYEHLRDFYVYIEDGEVTGTCALHISWEDLAEIRSIVVADDHKGKGAGKALVEECLKEAMLLGIQKIFVLTYIPGFFEKFDFKKIDKGELPHKVWSDCVKCVKFPDCDEIAMIRQFTS
jgi:amino-acid N-acetyltransferase